MSRFLGIALAASALQPVPPQHTVRAHAFVLVDSAGAPRAELTFDNLRRPVLRFYDEHGRVSWSAPGARIVPAR